MVCSFIFYITPVTICLTILLKLKKRLKTGIQRNFYLVTADKEGKERQICKFLFFSQVMAEAPALP